MGVSVAASGCRATVFSSAYLPLGQMLEAMTTVPGATVSVIPATSAALSLAPLLSSSQCRYDTGIVVKFENKPPRFYCQFKVRETKFQYLQQVLTGMVVHIIHWPGHQILSCTCTC